MGTDKFICFAIHHPSWTCLLLLVIFCFVANLEFPEPSSSVHTVYGWHGYIPPRFDWDIQATIRHVPYRLSLLGWMHARNNTDIDEE
jgi:hypothetical protein